MSDDRSDRRATICITANVNTKPHLREIVDRFTRELRSRFGATSDVVFDVYTDPDGDGPPELMIVVRTTLSCDSVIERLDSFENDYVSAQPDPRVNDVGVAIEFK